MSSSRRGRQRGDLLGQVDQLVGGVAHRRHRRRPRRCPARLVATIRSATRLIRSASATDEPPYFCTTSPTSSPHPLARPDCPARPHYGQACATSAGAKGEPMTGPETLGGRLRRGAAPFVAPTPGVHARGVRRSFGPVHAVQGIDLDAPPGQVTALVGPNGAGKTTLMLVLATLLKPDAGEVRVAGFDPVTAGRRGAGPDGLVAGRLRAVRQPQLHRVPRGDGGRVRLPKHARADRARQLLELARLPEKADGAGAQPVPRAEAAARPGPGAGARPGGAAAGRAGLRAGPAQPGRAARPAAPVRRRGPRGAGLQPHPVRPGGGRRPGGLRGPAAGRSAQHKVGELPAAQSIRTYRLRSLDPDALAGHWSGPAWAGWTRATPASTSRWSAASGPRPGCCPSWSPRACRSARSRRSAARWRRPTSTSWRTEVSERA